MLHIIYIEYYIVICNPDRSIRHPDDECTIIRISSQDLAKTVVSMDGIKKLFMNDVRRTRINHSIRHSEHWSPHFSIFHSETEARGSAEIVAHKAT